MGWWGEQVLPHVMDLGLRGEPVAGLRDRACAGLAGDIVELGFGSGLNLAHLPDTVTSVYAVEPSDTAWRLAQPRIHRRGITVQRGSLDGARLDLPDASLDGALTTFTLCTIPDLDAALAELRRVLRPGAAVHFVEHGLAPDAGTVRWQRRLDGLQQRFVGGCHLTRDIPERLTRAGFTLEGDSAAYLPGPKPSHPWTYVHVGRARRPA